MKKQGKTVTAFLFFTQQRHTKQQINQNNNSTEQIQERQSGHYVAYIYYKEPIMDIEMILKEKEGITLEAKAAQNGLPRNIWETYSAFANTYGGIILLGVKEEADGTLIPIGVPEPQSLAKDFWNTISNRNKVNINLLASSDISIQEIQGKEIIVIKVPQATHFDKPIYLNGNISETYRRSGEGDHRCSEREIFSMVRDSAAGSSDMAMLPSLPIEALCDETIARYRNLFASKKPSHIWSTLPKEDFLYRISAIRKDNDGTAHPTRAGLLMFGHESYIRMKYDRFFLEYIEKNNNSERWTDRITSSELAAGNIFDFFMLVSNKLEEGLKKPFMLDGFYRVDDTPMHRAVREALANALIHADYEEGGNTTIIKRKERMLFSNPGNFRTDMEAAKQGGISDTRNPAICTMFSMIDIAERARAGLESIFRTWRTMDLPEPILQETLSPARATLELPLVEKQNTQLSEAYQQYHTLSNDEERTIDYLSVLSPISLPALSSMMHMPISTLRTILVKLEENGIVKSEGRTRNRKYALTPKI